LVWATLGEGGLVLALATIGWATNQPLIFASLGPTAYELVEQPSVNDIYFNRAARCSPTRMAFAIAVSAGLTAPMLTKKLVSTTYRLSSS
jgi:hypothetical protein